MDFMNKFFLLYLYMANWYREEINGKTYFITKSTNKKKKYDVYHNNKKILSFGARDYEHYFDKFGEFEKLNHNDKKRREAYRRRSEGIGNLNNPLSSNFWSYHYLW